MTSGFRSEVNNGIEIASEVISKRPQKPADWIDQLKVYADLKSLLLPISTVNIDLLFRGHMTIQRSALTLI